MVAAARGATNGTRRPLGVATCAAPVENPGLLRALLVGDGPLQDNLAGGGGDHGSLFRTGWIANDRRLAGAASATTSFREKLLPAEQGGESEGASLTHPWSGNSVWGEAQLARLLTLQRNSVGGAVGRSGAGSTWDVVAFTRLTGGLCASPTCADFSAVATLGGASPPNTTPLLTRTATVNDAGAPVVPPLTQTVAMFEHDVLTLGRAAAADPGWLRTPSGEQVWGGPPVARVNALTPAYAAVVKDAENNARPSAAMELAAYAWCQEPRSAFIHSHAYNLCKGVPEATVPTPAIFVGNAGATPIAVAGDVAPIDVVWTYSGAPGGDGGGGGSGPCPDAAFTATYAPRPEWLAGLGSREVNPASEDEVALARTMSSCTVATPAGVGEGGAPGSVGDLYSLLLLEERERRRALTTSLSRVYDGKVFRRAEPDQPASNAEVVLAVVVVTPAIVALLVGVATGKKWDDHAYFQYGAAFLGGLFGLTGIITLAVIEGEGDAFRAVALRSVLHVQTGGTAAAPSPDPLLLPDLNGSRLLLSETVYVVARSGYRRGMLVGLAGGLCGGYAALGLVVLGVALWANSQKYEESQSTVQEAHAGRVCVGSKAEEGKPLKAGVVVDKEPRKSTPDSCSDQA